MRAGLDSLSEFREGHLELRMALALRHFWRFHGHLTEGRRRLQSTLEGGGAADQVLKARALAAVGLIAHLQGDYHSARARLKKHWTSRNSTTSANASPAP
jgi:hypothetical protein